MRRRFSLAVPFALSLTACLGVPSAYRGSYPLNPALTSAAHAGFAPDAPIVILSERRRVKYLERGALEEDIYRAISIRRPDVLGYGTVTLPYAEAELLNLTGVTRLPDGRAVPFDRRTMLSVPRFRGGGEAASTHYATVLPFPAVVPGAIIELSFTIRRDKWVPVASLYLDADLPIRFAELVVLHPREVVLERRPRPGVWRTASKVENAQYSATTFTLRDYQPGKVLDFLAEDPSVSTEAWWGRIVGPRSSLEYFGGWALPAGQAWKEWTELAALPRPPELAFSSDDPRVKVATILRWVEAQLLDRESAFDPDKGIRSATTILESRLGSSNDRALVLYAMMRAQKLDPELVVLDADGSDLYPSPRPLSFERDVVLLRVKAGGDTVWVDPACLACRPGELTPSRQHRRGIVMRFLGGTLKAIENGGSLPIAVPEVNVAPIRTPAQGERGRARERFAVELTPRGLLVTEGRIEYRGPAAADLRHWATTHAPGERRDGAKRFVDGWADGEITFEVGEELAAVRLSNVLLARGGFVHTRRHVVVDLASLFPEPWLGAAQRQRAETLRLAPMRGFDRTVELTIPSGTQVSSAPETKVIENAQGRYSLVVEARGDRALLQEKLDLPSVEVVPADQAELRKLLKQIVEARRLPLVLVQR